MVAALGALLAASARADVTAPVATSSPSETAPPAPSPTPSTTANTWLGLQLETMPSGVVDVTTGGTTATAPAGLGFGIAGYLERRLIGPYVIVGLAPRLITPVQIRGVDGKGDELDLRGEVAVGGPYAPMVHLHVVGSLGYSWLFRALRYTDPGTGSTTYYTTQGPIAGFGGRATYIVNARLSVVSEISYHWGFQGGARVGTTLPVDIGVADRYLTIGLGVATALD